MKKLLYLLIFFAAAWSLYSCSPEQDDIFSESAANRMTDQIQSYKSILTEAPGGWLMQYYPDGDQAYGGYNYLISFGSGDSAVIATDIASPDQTETSLYALISDAGPVLTFNTYNSLFHFFSEPKGSSDIDGYSGDYEFIFMDVTPEKIVMKGKKSGNRIVMTRLEAGTDWTDYLTKILAMENQSLFGTYQVYKDGVQMLTIASSNRNFVIPDTVDGIPGTYGAGFIYTAEGIEMYKPLTLAGVQINGFRWDASQKVLVSTGTTASIQLKPILPSFYREYDFFIGNWNFTSGSTSIAVQIQEKQAGKTYTMKGLRYDITLQYNKLQGTVSINPQYVGMFQDYYVYVCVLGGGYVTWGEEYGYIGVWNEQEGTPVITFQDSGKWDYPISGFVFYAFTSETPSGSTVAGRIGDPMNNATLTKQ